MRGSDGSLLAVVWDMDGTLIDSTEAVTGAYIATVAALGGPPTTAEAVVAAYPLGPPAILLAHLLGRATTEADVAAYMTRLRAGAPAAPPYPGIRETLERLQGRVGLGVFTGANHESAMILLEATGLASNFGVVVGGDQVERVKPAPDGVLAACGALGVAPARAAYVGDSPSDLRAARASGARAFAAGWGHLYRQDEPADRVLARPEELLSLVGA